MHPFWRSVRLSVAQVLCCALILPLLAVINPGLRARRGRRDLGRSLYGCLPEAFADPFSAETGSEVQIAMPRVGTTQCGSAGRGRQCHLGPD